MGKLKTLAIAAIAGFGGLLFGYDQGIITSTLVQPDFIQEFNNPSPALQGGIVSSFSGGAFVGAAFAGYLADKISRKRTIMVGAVIAIIGCALQTGAVHVAMMVIGRLIAGAAIGILSMVVPMYNSEISHPSNRGLNAGLWQQMLSFGFLSANWIGYGSGFLNGPVQWRLGLGLQMVPAAFLLLGIFFVPYSPRWLLKQGRNEEAMQSLRSLHSNGSNDEWIHAEYDEMLAQVEHDRTLGKADIRDLVRTPGMRKRTALSCSLQFMTQMTGIPVINYFGPALYTTLGIEGNDRLLLTGISGIIGPVVCAIAIFFIIDRVGRKGPLIVGSLGCAMAMAILAAIVNNFGPTSSNRTALRVGVAMPFLFSVFFSFSFGPISWIYSNELWTTRTRSMGVAAATCSSWAANVLFGQTGSIGIADAGWSFYIAFVVFGVFDAVIIYFFFPETKGLSLEAIAAFFNDGDQTQTVVDPRVSAGAKAEKNDEVFEDLSERKAGSV